MQFTPQFLDQLRSRLAVSEVVGKRVKLIRKGKEYSGLCPFHNEKTPSFTVNDMKGFYHCFGCGAHGDVIRFTMETTGIGYVEAITRLAGEVGMPLPAVSREQQQRYQKTATLYEAMELACAFFQKNLFTTLGAGAREYLKQRQVSNEMVAAFRIGFAPNNRSALKSFLKGKGVPDATIKAAGLLSEGNGESYDKFRNRLIFPITDIRKRVIAFGGRIMGEGQPKYLNSPETELFHKGEVLYALSQARQAIHEAGSIVVTEGYMDVIAMHEAGIAETVAPLGTAITENHLAMLWKLASEPVLCLDGDEAGKRAMFRVAEMALKSLKPGHSLKFCTLPVKMDPDDVIRSQGVGAMRTLLEKSMPLSEILWDTCLEQMPVQTPEHKAALEARLMEYVGQIADTKVQTYYRRYFQEKLWEFNRGQKFQKLPIKQGKLPQPATFQSFMLEAPRSAIEHCEYVLLGIILKHPELLDDPVIEEQFSHIELVSEKLDKMRVVVLEMKNFAPTLKGEVGDVLSAMDAQGFRKEAWEALREWERASHVPGAVAESPGSIWERVSHSHHIAILEREYGKKLLEMTAEAEAKAFELKKEIDTLKEKSGV